MISKGSGSPSLERSPRAESNSAMSTINRVPTQHSCVVFEHFQGLSPGPGSVCVQQADQELWRSVLPRSCQSLPLPDGFIITESPPTASPLAATGEMGLM